MPPQLHSFHKRSVVWMQCPAFAPLQTLGSLLQEVEGSKNSETKRKHLRRRHAATAWSREVLVPLAVLVVGASFSVSALGVALAGLQSAGDQ